ncbi:hypothetical protein CALVIDRAFT_560867 [Calocera viscosa TUFC12733]|uniref:Sin3 associated polypeptide p18-domain-containing protein n=1 Tax=Calocera viscosa (strain TUFC12733) TaxID=1330018 RepID=A0A167QVF5_CALVF|nr:hypothetical protein CALVIDRAFT_560867 [Calocera viscosa TUFC12733]
MTDIKSSRPTVERDKTCPFLLRTFVRPGSFHPLAAFDTSLPTADEYQLYTWRDATLKELVTLLRAAVPAAGAAALRSPLARFNFRVVFTDPGRGGRVGSKDLGVVHARELVDPSLLLHDEAPGEDEPMSPAKENGHGPAGEERTLEELRLVPGDYLSVSVLTPHMGRAIASAGAQQAAPSFGIRGMGGTGRGGRGSDAGWHWRGRGGPAPGGAGRGVGRGMQREREEDRRPGGFDRRAVDRDLDRERDRERLDRELDRPFNRERERERERDTGYGRRAPLPRRDLSPEREMDWGDDAPESKKRRRSPSYSPIRRSASRSRSPPRKRESFRD